MPSLRTLANVTGFSVATVSRALRNDPAVRRTTREAVWSAARQADYKVNPYVGRMMSSLRRQRGEAFRGNLALVWLDEPSLPGVAGNLNELRGGARARAGELGYLLDEFVLADFEPRALAKILRSRGIRGILFSPPWGAAGKIRLKMRLDDFAAVALGWGVLHPQLHTVRFDHFLAMRMAIQQAHRRFGRGIAAFWDFGANRRADQTFRAAFLAHHPAGSIAAGELFFESGRFDSKRTLDLLLRRRVRCVLTNAGAGLSRCLEPWREAAIHWGDPGDQPCLGWVDSQYSLLGRWGMDLLAGALQCNEYGIPATPKTMLVPSRWVDGVT